MRKHLYIIALFLLTIVSCTPDMGVGTPFVEGQEVTITASVANRTSNAKQQPSKQRVSGKDAGVTIDLRWNAGDEILVSVGDKSAVFTLSSGENSSSGTFTGKMPADGSEYSVSYPVDYSEDVLTDQTYVANGFGKGLMKMSTKQAGTIDNGFTLSADNALLGLQLTGNRKIGKIVLSRNNSAGKVGDESYTLLCPNVVLTAEPTLFYIVVLPGTWANGFTVEVIANDNSVVIDRFVKTSSITFGTDNAIIMPEKNVQPEPEYVDLGLSVKWATFNVGATSPEDYGDYFAWGETEPKEEYNWATYKWCDGTATNMTKYNATDGKTILDIEDDAAHVNYGSKWRMPSDEEMTELRENCTWTWTTTNGINGYLVTSKKEGYTDKSIFLPAAGFRMESKLHYPNNHGDYWTSSRTSSEPRIFHLYFEPNNVHHSSSWRYYGMPIRPVYDDIADPCLVVPVNDTLSINLMCVEGGTFMMGSDAPDAEADEQPVHEVTLSDYYIGQTEVTQHLWKSVMGNDNNPSANEGNNLPVTNITWDEAQQFVERLSELTGMRVRNYTKDLQICNIFCNFAAQIVNRKYSNSKSV